MGVDVLIVVDVQNDFVTGALGSDEAAAKVDAIVQKAARFDGLVLLTQDTHGTDYLSTLEGANLPVEHCIRDTWGWRFPEELQKLVEERDLRVFEKPTFGSQELVSYLVALNARKPIRSIELIGFCTDICVISNALLIKAALPDVPLSVDPALCGATSDAAQEAALLVMKSNHVAVRA